MPDSRQAFHQLADSYREARPTYPEPLWEDLRAATVEVPVPTVAVDVGAGTGISTRQLADALPDWRVVGVEPGHSMRELAVEDSDGTGVEFLDAPAEELPFADGSVGVVLAAQAVQWFDRPRFFDEARRVLAAGGLIAALQNNRDWRRSAFLDDYESYLEAWSPGYRRDYRSFDVAAELTAAGFDKVSSRTVQWTRTMTADRFVQMARSSSKMQAAVDALGERDAVARVLGLIDQHHPRGEVDVPYTSELFTGRSPSHGPTTGHRP